MKRTGNGSATSGALVGRSLTITGQPSQDPKQTDYRWFPRDLERYAGKTGEIVDVRETGDSIAPYEANVLIDGTPVSVPLGAWVKIGDAKPRAETASRVEVLEGKVITTQNDLAEARRLLACVRDLMDSKGNYEPDDLPFDGTCGSAPMSEQIHHFLARTEGGAE